VRVLLASISPQEGSAMKNKRFASFLAVVACGGIGLLPIQANARTNYQTSLVPNVAGSTPGFSAKGSSIRPLTAPQPVTASRSRPCA
jgi:hypothetical protein